MLFFIVCLMFNVQVNLYMTLIDCTIIIFNVYYSFDFVYYKKNDLYNIQNLILKKLNDLIIYQI
jgi:hypothetical protein